MQSVGVYEAKTHLSKILARVAKGERITIEKHGVPVAVIIPPDAANKPPVKEVIAEFKRLREKYSLDGLSIRELVEEGRD